MVFWEVEMDQEIEERKNYSDRCDVPEPQMVDTQNHTGFSRDTTEKPTAFSGQVFLTRLSRTHRCSQSLRECSRNRDVIRANLMIV